MAGRKRLLIGLGNPGAAYEETRHNVGFMILDAVAEKARMTFKEDGRARALVGDGRLRGRPVMLVKPLTYMNRSGATVKHLLRRFGLEPAEILVIVDDLNLPLGKIRLRGHGGDGGHNGLEDIIVALGTDAFPRLRVGIGASFERGQQVDFVLSPFSDDEEPLLQEVIVRTRDAAVAFVRDGLVTAMNRFN